MVRDLGAGQLAEVGGVEHEQEGRAAPAVEHDREQHPVILRGRVGTPDEHGLTGPALRLVPGRGGALHDVGADDPVHPIAVLADTPGVAVRALVVMRVVDLGELDGRVDQALVGDRALARAQVEATQLGGSVGRALAQPVQVEVLDDRGVGVDAGVDDKLVAVLVGVDVMEGEAGVGLERAADRPGRAVDEDEPGAALGPPAIILSIWPPGQREAQRVDRPRELGQDVPALGESERVDIAGLSDRDGGQDLGRSVSGGTR